MGQAAELLLDEDVEAEADEAAGADVDDVDEPDVEEEAEADALEPVLEEPDFAAGELLDEEPRLSLR